MTSDSWSAWAATWQAAATPIETPATIRRQVDGASGRLRRQLVGEVLVTLGVFGAAAAAGLLSRPGGAGWLAAALVHTAAVWGFAVWNRRGIWRPTGATTRDYVALAVERGRRQLRSAHFVASLTLAELIGVGGWAAVRSDHAVGVLVALPVFTLVLAWAVRFRARSRRELARWVAIRDELALDGNPARETAPSP